MSLKNQKTSFLECVHNQWSYYTILYNIQPHQMSRNNCYVKIEWNKNHLCREWYHTPSLFIIIITSLLSLSFCLLCWSWSGTAYMLAHVRPLPSQTQNYSLTCNVVSGSLLSQKSKEAASTCSLHKQRDSRHYTLLISWSLTSKQEFQLILCSSLTLLFHTGSAQRYHTDQG